MEDRKARPGGYIWPINNNPSALSLYISHFPLSQGTSIMVGVDTENTIDFVRFTNKVMQNLWNHFSQNKWWAKFCMCIGTKNGGYLCVYFIYPDWGTSIDMKKPRRSVQHINWRWWLRSAQYAMRSTRSVQKTQLVFDAGRKKKKDIQSYYARYAMRLTRSVERTVLVVGAGRNKQKDRKSYSAWYAMRSTCSFQQTLLVVNVGTSNHSGQWKGGLKEKTWVLVVYVGHLGIFLVKNDRQRIFKIYLGILLKKNAKAKFKLYLGTFFGRPWKYFHSPRNSL